MKSQKNSTFVKYFTLRFNESYIEWLDRPSALNMANKNLAQCALVKALIAAR
jgi:hypothetical protein